MFDLTSIQLNNELAIRQELHLRLKLPHTLPNMQVMIENIKDTAHHHGRDPVDVLETLSTMHVSRVSQAPKKAREPYPIVDRPEDMSPTGYLRLFIQPDGDVIVMVQSEDGAIATVEFCSCGGGGARDNADPLRCRSCVEYDGDQFKDWELE